MLPSLSAPAPGSGHGCRLDRCDVADRDDDRQRCIREPLKTAEPDFGSSSERTRALEDEDPHLDVPGVAGTLFPALGSVLVEPLRELVHLAVVNRDRADEPDALPRFLIHSSVGTVAWACRAGVRADILADGAAAIRGRYVAAAITSASRLASTASSTAYSASSTAACANLTAS
jgi:hypothetical protein